MPISYNGSYIIPCPLVSIDKTYTKSGDGQLIGAIFNISLNGKLIAFRGSPTSSGTFSTDGNDLTPEVIGSDTRLEAIQQKQDSLRNLFADEGKPLIVTAPNTNITMSGNPRLVSINFPQDRWYNYSDYTVNLECDNLYPENEDAYSNYISEASESWSIETDDRPEGMGNLSRTYRLSHSVSATGKRHYNNSGGILREAYQEAKNWVQAKLGIDSNFIRSTGVINLPSYYSGYNHVRNESLDEMAGSYSVVENWILSSGTAFEDFTVSTTNNIDEPHTNVRIEGVITGLEVVTSGSTILSSKYANANTKWVAVSGLAFTRAQLYSGKSLNIIPQASVIGKNPVAGVINYSYDFNNRPSNLVANAKSEVISVSDNVDGGRSFAEIFILNRSSGPVLQDLGTRPSFKRILNIELLVNRPVVSGHVTSIRNAFYASNPRLATATSGDINNIITALDPAEIGINACHSDPPQENWNFRDGRYSYTRTWTYVPSG